MMKLRALRDIDVYRLITKAEVGLISPEDCLKELKQRAKESLLLDEQRKDDEFEVCF